MAGVPCDLDAAFKALGDPTRRAVLDRLFERPGQTVSDLCSRVEMTRQALSQHLAVLETANLVATVWHGREKLHYLNPIPLHEIQRRWIHKFEHARLDVLAGVKQEAESRRPMSELPAFLYVTYVEASADRVWQALTDADLTARYWGHRNVSEWTPGSGWEHQRTDGSATADVRGTVVEARPPHVLVLTWSYPDQPDSGSRVRFEIEPWDTEMVRLVVTHSELIDPDEHRGISAGWAAVLANLKTLLETGSPLPVDPWVSPHS
jgi:uncharacterized protein YndB with AHSA1/START domain/DNA-binding transcriptional ArsR family regulator